MSAITFLITDAGRAAAVNANVAGLQVQLSHVTFGAGKFTPAGATTALVDQREVSIVEPGSSVIGTNAVVSALFLASNYSGANYVVGEIGIWIGVPGSGGVLFAVASSTTANYGSRGAEAGDASISLTLAISGVPSGSVSVLMDPTAAQSAALMARHKADGDPHPQYIQRDGDTMDGDLFLSADVTDPLAVVPLRQVRAMLEAIRPIGEVAGFYRLALPSGWVLLGATVSRTTYAALYAVLIAVKPSIASTGDGSTTFQVPANPDFFRNVGAGRVVGYMQSDALQNFTGEFAITHGGVASTSGVFDDNGTSSATHITAGVSGSNVGITFDASRSARTADETRPKSMTLLFGIWSGVF